MSASMAEVVTAHFTVTFFTDAAAAAKREEAICLHDLADLIATTSASSKGQLPWLKLARFGDTRTGKGLLRHNANVLMITGLEGDYDGGRIAFYDARAILQEAGVLAIVYTSPSHTENAPRWRVLCPLSAELMPERREQLMARLNGLFHGVFSGESWTLSQSYYLGSVNQNPSHRVEMIDGTPIDLMDKLDATAIGKPQTKINGHANERPVSSGRVPMSRRPTPGLRRSACPCWTRFAVRLSTDRSTCLAQCGEDPGGIHACWIHRRAGHPVARGRTADFVENWGAAKETAAWGLAAGRLEPIALPDRPYVGTRRRF